MTFTHEAIHGGIATGPGRHCTLPSRSGERPVGGRHHGQRFADQPALLNADLTADEREALQKRVEMLHENWTKDREYLPPPTVGKLADLDPAVLVTPSKGLEVGYVPIVTKQAAKE